MAWFLQRGKQKNAGEGAKSIMVKCGRAALLAVVLLLAGMAGYQRHVSMQQDVLLNQRSREHFERMYEDALAEEAVWRSKLEAQTQRMRASLAEIDTLKGEGRAAQAQIRSSTLEKNSLLQKAEELGQRVEALQKQVAEHQQERAAAEDTRRGEEEEDSSEQEKDEDDDRDAMHGGVKLEEVTRGSKQQPAPLGIRRAAADVEDHALKSAFGTETKIGTAAAGSNGVLKRNVGLQQEEEEEQDERQEGLADAR
eukprot:jgi/Mesen1/7637/ME000004S07908